MDQTALSAIIHRRLPLPCKRSPDGGCPDWGCGHLIAAYYSFIYPERMKGCVGLVGWRTANGLVVTHQLQVGRRTGKVRRSKTNVLPRNNQPEDTCRDCRHWAAQSWLQIQNSLLCFRRSVHCLVDLTVCHRKGHRFVGRIGSGELVSATLYTV